MNTKGYLVLGILAIISIFFGGTLSYWQWSTNTSQKTNIVVTVGPTFMCEVDGGGDITQSDAFIAPAKCTSSDHAIKRKVVVTPTIYGQNPILMNLWLDIKTIGSGLSNSSNFKYAITTDPNSCTNNIVKSGSFKGTKNNDKVELFNYMGYSQSTVDTYYLYVWLDKEESSSSTMNQKFSLSLNGMCTDAPEPETYVVFSEEDTTLRLYKRDENISQVSNNDSKTNISRLNNNIEKIEDLTITDEDKITFDLENTTYSSAEQLPWYEYRESITKVIFEDEIKPKSMAYWFDGMSNVEYIDVSKVNTSRITNMSGLFYNVALNVTGEFEIFGLDYWDVSNVINMNSMFSAAGMNATLWSIGDLSNWDVSNVYYMGEMFSSAGNNATNWYLDLSGWNVSSVTYMANIFRYTGYNSSIFELNLTNWNLFGVKSFHRMFEDCGKNTTSFSIIGLSTWDVSNVTDMSNTFWGAGQNATTWSIGDLSNWDVSNVEEFAYTFAHAGINITDWSIGDLTNWDVSSAMSMHGMFTNSGFNSSTWDIGDISSWDISNVTNMSYMFWYAGQNATYSMDLSGWNVSNVTSYNNFGDTSKITPPVWNTSS